MTRETTDSKYQGHTPGPLSLRIGGEAIGVYARTPAGEDLLLATVHHQYCEESEYEPNARLIADAPALLAQRDAALARAERAEAALRLITDETDRLACHNGPISARDLFAMHDTPRAALAAAGKAGAT